MKETIVFVHGMSHGAWCWEEYFVPYFEQQGYACVAINLPGHEVAGSTKAIHYAMSDYVHALSEVVGKLSLDPIIMGHSMGGMILQRFLAKGGRCKQAILMSSVPPVGVLMPSLRVLFQNPGAFKFLFQANLLGVFRKYPRLMFGSNEKTEQYANLMCAESFWAYLQLMMPIGRVQKKLPTLVMGGSADALISVNEFKQTAEYYGTSLELIEGGSHDLMLDPNAHQHAALIHRWLENS
ncbi:alpha/beta hydrolase [Aquirufa sp. OSTEICH-129V]|uniref:Alpha/beta hydrolase n=1 Tax=Aquirufa avitistagni TaxID=3104728 RepID=A0ABW6DE14_9BACT